MCLLTSSARTRTASKKSRLVTKTYTIGTVERIGRYRLDRYVRSGAFATVWRGWDPELDTAVAVKVLADNWMQHAGVCERFLAEARLLRRIDSRRVVRVHDVGVAENRPYFVSVLRHGRRRGGTLATAASA